MKFMFFEFFACKKNEIHDFLKFFKVAKNEIHVRIILDLEEHTIDAFPVQHFSF